MLFPNKAVELQIEQIYLLISVYEYLYTGKYYMAVELGCKVFNFNYLDQLRVLKFFKERAHNH